MERQHYNPIPVIDISTITVDEWLEKRKDGIGASDAPIILGVSQWNNTLDLYHQKVKSEKLADEPKDLDKEYRLEFGHYLEEFVAFWFRQAFDDRFKTLFSMQMGKNIESIEIIKDNMMYKHPINQFMLADLDYIIVFHYEDKTEQRGVFECKTTSPYTIKDNWKEQLPYSYELQCRHAMAVMDYDFTVIACAADNSYNNYFAHIIARDIDKEEMIIKAEQKFWNRVCKKQPPEITMNAADTYFSSILKYQAGKAHDDISKTETELVKSKKAFTSYFAVSDKIAALKDKIKALEKKQTAETARIFSQMGDFDFGIYDDEDYCYRAEKYQKTSSSFDKKSLQKVMPDVVDKYTKTTEKTELIITKTAKTSLGKLIA